MFKQMNSHWEAAVLQALKLPEAVDLWYAELPQVWQQIEASYSGSLIAGEGRVTKPFEHRWGGHKVGAYPYGGHYVATSGMFSRYVDYHTCYLLTAREAFSGEVGTYRAWEWETKRGSERGGYHGMMVAWQKRPYVLTGPPLIWWRKGPFFEELIEVVHAPTPQKVIRLQEMKPPLTRAVQLKLF